ncbi:MAG: class I SAM-dependent methyltransferase [Sphingobium sp.]
MSYSHPMIPAPSHDEMAEQLFVRDLKLFVMNDLEPVQREMAMQVADAVDVRATNDPVGNLRSEMMERGSFRQWLGMRRESQLLLWDVVGDSLDRRSDELAARADIAQPKGSVRTDADFTAPGYLVDGDVHLMPGGYAADPGEGSVAQGALMDRGGAIYMLGRNGGFLNDFRGHTAMAHVLTCYPDLDPARIVELGCGVGSSTVPATLCFPEAEVHGVDVGASMLRYAHARAEQLGVGIHFSQQNAESTDFPDASFDLVYTCAVMHETSQSAVGNIIRESRRLLRPGGVAVHLEVPLLMTIGSLWDELSAELEADYNNEPYWRGALTADYEGLMRAAGFQDVKSGYQRAAMAGARDANLHFGPDSEGVFRSWFVTSGRA